MRRAVILAFFAAGALLIVGVITTRGSGQAASCTRSIVPAYLDPPEFLAFVQRPSAPHAIILNPASGPGAAPDPTYVQAVGIARSRGIHVLGYLATGWGSRSAADVDADIDRYHSWYGVDGVFLDEAAASSEQVAHYRALADHARAVGAGLVALNPGIVPASGYFDFADIVVTFEGAYPEYRDRRDQLTGAPADRSAHLVYGATREQALEALTPGPGAGYVYITSGSLPHPWGSVPDYLDAELSALGTC